MTLSYRWHDSIDELSEEEWTFCFGEGDVLRGYALQQAAEQSAVADRFIISALKKMGSWQVLSAVSHCFIHCPILPLPNCNNSFNALENITRIC